MGRLYRKGVATQVTLREGCGCPKFLAGKVLRQISTLLKNYSPIFRQHEMLSLSRFGHLPATKMAAGKSAPPSGTLLDFLLRDRHSLQLSFFFDPTTRLLRRVLRRVLKTAFEKVLRRVLRRCLEVGF